MLLPNHCEESNVDRWRTLLISLCYEQYPVTRMIAGGSLERVVIGREKLFLNSRVEKLLCYVAITRASAFRLSLKSESSATRLSRGQVPRLTSDNFTYFHTEIERGYHDFCLSRNIILTNPTSRKRESNPRPHAQESRAVPIELPCPLITRTAARFFAGQRSVH